MEGSRSFEGRMSPPPIPEEIYDLTHEDTLPFEKTNPDSDLKETQAYLDSLPPDERQALIAKINDSEDIFTSAKKLEMDRTQEMDLPDEVRAFNDTEELKGLTDLAGEEEADEIDGEDTMEEPLRKAS